MNMKKYTTPDLEIVVIEENDVLTSSGPEVKTDPQWFDIEG